MQNEHIKKLFKEKEKEFYSSPSQVSCPGYTTFTKKRVLQGRDFWGKVVYDFYTELQTILTEDIPESYRLCVFSVHKAA